MQDSFNPAYRYGTMIYKAEDSKFENYLVASHKPNHPLSLGAYINTHRQNSPNTLRVGLHSKNGSLGAQISTIMGTFSQNIKILGWVDSELVRGPKVAAKIGLKYYKNNEPFWVSYVHEFSYRAEMTLAQLQSTPRVTSVDHFYMRWVEGLMV